MGTRGIKICGACRRSFEPQFTDDEILRLWYTEEEIEADDEHEAQTGHSHLEAPSQELCPSCSMDPDVVYVGAPFGGRPVYRKKKEKPRRIPVQDGNVVAPPRPRHEVRTTDGLRMTVEGPLPPQEIIDAMGAAIRAGSAGGTITPVPADPIVSEKKTLWQRIFGKKKP